VNEASRIEVLSDKLNHYLLVSAAIAAAAN
jgi:hypothetical protein